jgi:hypothetical protein
MTVQEFFIHFRYNLPRKPRNRNWTFSDYQKWHLVFYEQTAPFHISVKQSFFEQVNELIDKASYSKVRAQLYQKKLCRFAHLGLFTQEDEANFAIIVKKLSQQLLATNNSEEMEALLWNIYSLADFLMHEIYPENEESGLVSALRELRSTILETKKLDKEGTGELVIRFINSMA